MVVPWPMWALERMVMRSLYTGDGDAEFVGRGISCYSTVEGAAVTIG